MISGNKVSHKRGFEPPPPPEEGHVIELTCVLCRPITITNTIAVKVYRIVALKARFLMVVHGSLQVPDKLSRCTDKNDSETL